MDCVFEEFLVYLGKVGTVWESINYYFKKLVACFTNKGRKKVFLTLGT
jgi:hypothetical protein